MTSSTLSFSLAFERDLAAADRCGRLALETAPPSGAVLAVVRQFGEAEEREDGLTLYRLTPCQLANADIAAMLGEEGARALDVALLWDDREEELVRVIDDAAIRPAAPAFSYAELKVRGDRRARYPRYARAA